MGEYYWDDYKDYPGGNPTDLGYFEWNVIESSNFQVHFVSDSYASSYGFDLLWKCKNLEDQKFSKINAIDYLVPTFFLIILAIYFFRKSKNIQC